MKVRINGSRAMRVRARRVRARRSWSAAVVACFGLFFVSAGVGLTATAANAAAKDKVVVCHATNSDTNPYGPKALHVDANSADYEGHLKHRNSPQQIWKQGTWFHDTWHPAGSAKPDLIDGLDGHVTEADCVGATSGIRTASASISILTQPSCKNNGVGTWRASATGATVSPDSGTGGSGDSVQTVATAMDGYQFGTGQRTKTLSATFDRYDPQACGDDSGTDPDPIEIAAPVLERNQPTCASSGAWSWSISGDHVTFKPASAGAGTFGDRADADTTVTATAAKGYEFADGSTQKVISVDFNFVYAPEGKLIDGSGACYSDETMPPSLTTVTSGVVVTQPTCQNGGLGSWRVTTPVSVAGDEMPAVVTALPGLSGSGAPGSSWSVALSPKDGYAFPDGFKSQFAGTFDEIPLLENQVWNAETRTCDSVMPPSGPPDDETPGEGPAEEQPGVKPVKPPVVLAPAPSAPTVKPTQNQVHSPVRGDATVIPTLVKAGLPGTPPASVSAPTSPFGTALTGAGLVLLAMAGGIASIGRRRERA